MMDRAESFSTERKGDRHGQGSDAQQQGKEEAEGRQEPQEGRHDSGQSVRHRQDAGRPKPQQQEELTAAFFSRRTQTSLRDISWRTRQRASGMRPTFTRTYSRIQPMIVAQGNTPIGSRRIEFFAD